MAEQELLVDVKNRVARLTMNRPDKLNAITPDMGNAAIAALKELAADPEVGAIVLTGAGRGFCAGGDVSRMAGGTSTRGNTYEERVDGLRARQEMSWLLHSLPKVTIAMVNGVAAGAGLGLALACDLRIASDQSRYGTAYANVGLGGDFGVTWGLTHTVGPAKAKELFFLPDVIDAAEALRIGMVNRVVPHDLLEEETVSIAERIAHGPLMSYRYMKDNVNRAVLADYRESLDREPETHLRCGQSEDHQEGVAAFMEKRRPNFRGV